MPLEYSTEPSTSSQIDQQYNYDEINNVAISSLSPSLCTGLTTAYERVEQSGYQSEMDKNFIKFCYQMMAATCIVEGKPVSRQKLLDL